nr:hypothetical protein [Nocardia panacis]
MVAHCPSGVADGQVADVDRVDLVVGVERRDPPVPAQSGTDVLDEVVALFDQAIPAKFGAAESRRPNPDCPAITGMAALDSSCNYLRQFTPAVRFAGWTAASELLSRWTCCAS